MPQRPERGSDGRSREARPGTDAGFIMMPQRLEGGRRARRARRAVA